MIRSIAGAFSICDRNPQPNAAPAGCATSLYGSKDSQPSLPYTKVAWVWLYGHNQMSILLIGYDVESNSEAPSFLANVLPLHKELEAPCTFFILGSVLEANAPCFKPFVGEPLFDLAQHTYSHVLLKTVLMDDGKKLELFRGGTPEQIDDEVGRTNKLLLDVLGIRCEGLAGPYCYYRGLADRPDLLDILAKHGILYLRTYARDHRDYQPTPIDVQPFWYDLQSHPDMLECMAHGWQDVYLRGMLGWENVDGYVETTVRDLEYVASADFTYSLCAHDWSSTRPDPSMPAMRRIIGSARSLGMEILSYRDYYQRRISERDNARD